MKVFRKIRYYKFLYSKSKNSLDFLPTHSSNLVLFTVAFNNVDFISLQISLLKENFVDDYFHCIIDNSSDYSKRAEIKNVCKKLKVSYFSVPKNIYINNKSHASAMHWAYFQIVRKYNFDYFGFIDHDIFPFSSFSLKSKMKLEFYGRVVNSYFIGGYCDRITKDAPYWSIWAGFCFFKSSLLEGAYPWQFNFFSKHFSRGFFLDTGGGLWNILYSKIEYPNELATYKKIKLDDCIDIGDQNEGFEIFDESWIHFVSLSNWRAVSEIETKKKVFMELIKVLNT